MSNFNNVTMGSGVLKINNVDVGFLKGDVLYKHNYDIAEFKTGCPLSLKGSLTKEIFAELTAPLAEITADNIAQILGGLTKTTENGAEVDKTGASESHTFAQAPMSQSSGLACIKLGPTTNFDLWVAVSTAGDAPVIKDTTEVTTYTENDDYIVDYKTGYVYRNPGGAIGATELVKVKYKYTPLASEQLELGIQQSLTDIKVEFIHTNPSTSKDISIVMWKANADGSAELAFTEGSFLIENAVFKAVYDSTHATNPLGYINFEL